MLSWWRKKKSARARRWMWVGLWGWMTLPFLLGAANPSGAPLSGDSRGMAVILTVVGSINAGTADYIREGILQAKRQNASLVILKLDTPGGFLQATRDIVKSILNAELPVVVFVTPAGARAGSAGVFITLSGHIAAMSPGTNIGAAHPVTSGGKDPEKEGGKHMAKKIENDTVAFVEAIAKKRNRNVQWARKAVLESDSITSEEALKLKVIDLEAPDIATLLARIDGKKVQVGNQTITLRTKGMPVRDLQMTFKQKIVNLFASPQIFYFLMMLGMLGIMAELYHPGAIFPGVVGAICLLLSLVAMQAIPINYGGFALILLGLLLLVAELFTPTFGVLFVGGLISLTVGSIFLIDSPDPSMRLSLSTILPTISVLAVLLGLIMFAMMQAVKRPVVSGSESMIGGLGEAYSGLSPVGKVRFDGELWNALAPEGQEIPTGSAVRVVKVEGLTLHVVEASDSERKQKK